MGVHKGKLVTKDRFTPDLLLSTLQNSNDIRRFIGHA